MHHLQGLAETCADLSSRPNPILRLRVIALWAFADVLEQPGELDNVRVALVVDLPIEDVPWMGQPKGAEQWDHSTRLSRNPVVAFWRSSGAPVWNHYIDRPALLWDAATGMAEDTFAALRDGRTAEVRSAAPEPDELRKRLENELAVSRAALGRATTAYDDRRWSPGKLTPVADELWRASDGYLDVLNALDPVRSS